MKQFILASIIAGALALPAAAADYKIMAPAAPGGGWDQTARSMQTALQDEKISSSACRSTTFQAPVAPSAWRSSSTRPMAIRAQLIVGGYVMVGAILTNASPVTLDQITPIARLTGEYEAIVVPAASDIKDMAGLVAKLKADPGAVSWAGGSAGGTDHIARPDFSPRPLASTRPRSTTSPFPAAEKRSPQFLAAR
jgi:putative tricarboxylic transport membrane protein